MNKTVFYEYIIFDFWLFSSTWYMKTHVAAVHEETLEGIKCEKCGKRNKVWKDILKRGLVTPKFEIGQLLI